MPKEKKPDSVFEARFKEVATGLKEGLGRGEAPSCNNKKMYELLQRVLACPYKGKPRDCCGVAQKRLSF